MMKLLWYINRAYSGLLYAFLLFLPDEFSRLRIRYYNRRGCKISRYCSISPNVRIRGKVEIGKHSSIAQNCSITGEEAGVFIGENVMIAPNVVIIAFNHGYDMLDMPMRTQAHVQAPVVIEDDVWVAANCTIGLGVRVGKGSIIAANSFVNKDVPPFTIVGGVPAKTIGSRIRSK